MSTHPALVLSASGQMRLENVLTKRPHAGEILVSIIYVSICGSDLDLLRGSRPLGTRILGHEGVAEIVEVGEDPLTPFAVGQRVTFLPNNPADRQDILGVSTEGLFQKYLLIPQAALERGMVIPCDPHLPLMCGPLLEPFATVIYGQRLVEHVCRPTSVVVVGAGAIGLLNVLYAKAQGCSRVFLADTSRSRLDWAVRRGIVHNSSALLNSSKLGEMVLKATAGLGVDVVYICTPRAATRSVLEQALSLVREDGCINLTAGTDSREELPALPGVDLNELRQANVCGLGHRVDHCVTRVGKRIWLTGHSGASTQYLQEAMALLLKQAAVYAKVISHRVPYRAASLVFDALLTDSPHDLRDREPFVKVILDFTTEDQTIKEFEPDDG